MSTIKELKQELSSAGIAFPAKGTRTELEALVIHKQDTIDIAIQITMIDGTVHNQDLFIDNPGGCIFKSQINNPDHIKDMIKTGLVKMYGKHIRG